MALLIRENLIFVSCAHSEKDNHRLVENLACFVMGRISASDGVHEFEMMICAFPFGQNVFIAQGKVGANGAAPSSNRD